MTIQCQRCQAQLVPDSAFCAHCGTPVPAQTVPPPPTPSPRGINQPPRMPQPGTSYQPPANAAPRTARGWAGRAGMIFVSIVLIAAIKAGIRQYQFDHRPQPNASDLANLKSLLATTVTPATRLRLIQIGDTWHYTEQGQIQTASGQSVSFKGKYDNLVSRSTQGEPGPLAELVSSTLTFPNGKSIQHLDITYFRQDVATGDITEMGDSDGGRGTTRQVINPQVTTPGSWGVDVALSPSLRYDTGQTDRRSMRIMGMESVATGVGTLTTWKSSETGHTLKGDTIQSTVWYAPQIGEFVAEHSVSRDEDGTTISLDVILDSTNVPVH